MIVNVFTFFLVFFWMVPVTFVSSLSNLETLSKVEGLSFLVDVVESSTAVKNFVDGFLPSLALIIFMALLLLIIRVVSAQSGLYTISDLDKAVLNRYFLFQLFNVFLGYTISGTIFNSLNKLIDDPTSAVDLLASSLPQQANFFITYIMIFSMSKQMLALLNPAGLIIYHIKKKLLCNTERDLKLLNAVRI